MSALSPPKPVPVAAEPGALRIVLFGMPDAGKSSLLGALAQAAHSQGRALHGQLLDLSQGLGELRNRVYEGRPQETQEEIVPYPVRFTPYGQPGVSAVLYDCDGRTANELLTQKRSLVKEARAGTLAGAVLSADALILTVDAAAPHIQIEDDFREFLRFLRFLENHRARRNAVGGLPVYLVLTKCDRLAPDAGLTRAEWEARIDARKQEVIDQFRQFLAGAGVREGQFRFGSIDLEVRATAVHRPALLDSVPQPREPFGVAELFHTAFAEAAAFGLRRQRSYTRLLWTMIGTGGLFGVMAAAAVYFLLIPNRPVEPTLADRVEAIHASEGPTAATRLGPNLDRRMQEWLEVQADPGFAELSDAQQTLVRNRLEEGSAYIRFRDELDEIRPLVSRAQSEAGLKAIENRLRRLTPPTPHIGEWQPTEAVQTRDRLLTKEIPALREAVGRLSQFYFTLRNRAGALLQAPELNARWDQSVRSLAEAERAVPVARTDPAVGAAHGYDEVTVAAADWRKAHDRLTRLRSLAAALGLLGEPGADRAPLSPATPPEDPRMILPWVADRWQRLKAEFPDSGTWSLDAVPDGVRPEIEKQLRRTYDQSIRAGQRLTLDRLRSLTPGDLEVPGEWPRVGEYLLSPGLNDYRQYTAYQARLLDPTAEDPVEQTARFVRQPRFEINPARIRLRIPDTLSDAPVRPAGDLVLVHRPAAGGPDVRLSLRASAEAERDRQSMVYTFTGSGPAITYQPGDTFFAELPVRKDRLELKLTWAASRTMAFQFERLAREPRLHEPDQSNVDGLLAIGVTATVTDGPFPVVPPMIPVVRFGSK